MAVFIAKYWHIIGFKAQCCFNRVNVLFILYSFFNSWEKRGELPVSSVLGTVGSVQSNTLVNFRHPSLLFGTVLSSRDPLVLVYHNLLTSYKKKK